MPSIPFGPILAGLLRHRLTAAMLVMQVAFTVAIVSNAMAMISTRFERVRIDSGLPERELALVSVRGLQPGGATTAQQEADLARLRRIPGVRAASAVGDVLPLSDGANDSVGCISRQAFDAAIATRSYEHQPGCIASTGYYGSPGLAEALGARIVAGRAFTPLDYGDGAGAGAGAGNIIVSQSLAALMWPGRNAVGQQLYGGETPQTVVGVMGDLLRSRLRSTSEDRLVMLSPSRPTGTTTTYLLRSAPQDRERVLREAAAALREAGPLRLVPADNQRTFSQLRDAYFQRDTTMLGLLLASSLALLFVTALGIGGLASFWVGQRRRQIGIRRSLGATRTDILRYFQVENAMVVGAGAGAGILLAWLLGHLLAARYAVPPLPLAYLPAGALALLILGQLAVLWPARRAAAVPPALATRAA